MTDQLDQPSQATDQASQPSAEFVIPDAYKDRGWVEKVKSPDDLWKTLDNAQSLLGKRPAGIPANDAPKEEWDKFYALTRPESADKYAFSDIEGLPDGIDLSSYKEKAQKLMFEAGIHPKQADALWKLYIPTEIETAKELTAKQEAALDAEFDEAIAPLGDKKDYAMKVAKEAISEMVRPELQDSFANNPKGMVALIELAAGYEAKLSAVKAEYGAEGKLPDGGAKATGESIEDTVSKLAKLRLSPEAQDFTKAGHKKVMDEIASLQAVVARHYNK